MKKKLDFTILPQPNDTTCGPTCLHALYTYYGDSCSLEEVVDRIHMVEGGGTLAVILACDALARGYKATIYTYNLQIFDPTWFGPEAPDMRERLMQRQEHSHSRKFKTACSTYVDFLNLGGKVRFEDLNPALIRRYLNRDTPILTGLSSTYLYRTMRERGDTDMVPDDIGGDPEGHFVVLHGYNRSERSVYVADPYMPNPLGRGSLRYKVRIDRAVCAILLGVITYDANLLIIEPRKQ